MKPRSLSEEKHPNENYATAGLTQHRNVLANRSHSW